MALVDTLPTSAATIPDPPRYQAAGFWRRAAAAIVDLLVLCPVFAVLGAGVGLIFGRPLPRLRELGPDLLVSALVDEKFLGEALLMLCAILLLLYFFIFHAFR